MKHIALFLTIFLLLLSCTGEDRYERLLCHFEECNRNDIPLSVDSVLPIVQHYDHPWHSRLHRLRAYYMLGSAYRDQGEAPAALHCYNIAVQQADTAHADSATYATLLRVYGQMATIYGQQNMPQEELKALSSVSRYALLAKDTLSYILGYENRITPYYVMGDTAKTIQTTEKVYQLYARYGYRDMAAQIYPTAIYISLLNGNYPRAHHYMDIFERESGWFDAQGNIASGKEQYYENKGLYYINMHQPDSAEGYYRKLLSCGYLYEAYNGLLIIYAMTGYTDSIVKYASQYEEVLGEWVASRQTNTIIQSSAMYNYERNKRIAEQKAKDAAISHYIILLLFCCLAMLVLISFLIHVRNRKSQLEKELEYEQMAEKHMAIQITYSQQCDKLSQLQKSYKELQQVETGIEAESNAIQQEIKEKEQEITRLLEFVKAYQEDVMEKEEHLIREDIVVLFKDMAQFRYNGKKPTKKEWLKLVSTYRQYMPHIYARMQMSQLTERELHVCILTHLEFSTGAIVTLINVAASIISNVKASVNIKLFAETGATTLLKNLKKCAYFQS